MKSILSVLVVVLFSLSCGACATNTLKSDLPEGKSLHVGGFEVSGVQQTHEHPWGIDEDTSALILNNESTGEKIVVINKAHDSGAGKVALKAAGGIVDSGVQGALGQYLRHPDKVNVSQNGGGNNSTSTSNSGSNSNSSSNSNSESGEMLP